MRTLLLATLLAASSWAADVYEYRVLATNKTSTMEKEMNEAADAGFVFSHVMGGDTAMGGKEVVTVMVKNPGTEKKRYKLLATSKTSTMQKEMQAMGDEGFEMRGKRSLNPRSAGARLR